jgi:myo-inositol 2-dehydrogenase / D-chiro-inositol 1-dehydrogenase
MAIHLAIFGAGRIGRMHAKHVADHPEITLAYVVDPDAANAAVVAATTGAAVVEAEQVFADPSIDGVVIASSTDSHVDLVQRAAAAGKAVFCEKPLSLDYATAEACVGRLNRLQTRCMVGFHRRYDPSFRAVRERIHSGEAGKVCQIVIFSRSGAIPPIEYIKRSGGLFRDSSIHDLDMVRYLTGEEIATVYAVGGCLADKAIGAAGDIDTAMITLVSRSGILAQINNARESPIGYDQRLEVLAANAMMRVENVPQNNTVIGGPGGFTSARPVESYLERYAAAYRAEMDAFVAMITKGMAPLADHSDGLEAQRLAEAALRSFREGRPVAISELQDGC